MADFAMRLLKANSLNSRSRILFLEHYDKLKTQMLLAKTRKRSNIFPVSSHRLKTSLSEGNYEKSVSGASIFLVINGPSVW